MAYGRLTSPGRVIGSDVKNRYSMVSLKIGGRYLTHPKHWYVSEAFLGPRPEGLHVNHKDGRKHHNCPSNLEYVTPRENALHARRTGLQDLTGERCNFARLTEGDIREIHAKYAAGATTDDIVAQHGISKTHLSEIISGQAWKHLSLPVITRSTLFEQAHEVFKKHRHLSIDQLDSLLAEVPRLRHYKKTSRRMATYRAIRRLLDDGVVRRLGLGVYGITGQVK